MLETWSVAWLAALLLAAIVGYVLGWRLRQHGENERRRAIEASADEFVAAAGRARDRERAEREDVETRLRTLRREHAACGERIARLEAQRDELREDAGLPAAGGDDRPRDEPAAVPAVRRAPHRAGEGPPVTVRAWAAKSASRAARLEEDDSDTPPGGGNGVPAGDVPTGADAGGVEALPDVPASAERAARSGNGVNGAPVDPPAVAVANGEGATPDPPDAEVRPSWLLAEPRAGRRDDLQAIRGVGPSIEQRLNDLGIFHYRQLAGLGDEDVAWLGGQLGVFPGRVRRDCWCEQARSLMRRRARPRSRERPPSRDA